MNHHSFLLEPSAWLGEGKIRLSMVDEDLNFYTRWNIPQKNDTGHIECVQEIQVQGLNDVMYNQFAFSKIANDTFTIELENPALGKIEGRGLINDNVIAWEFRSNDVGFEGFEFYEKQDDGTYLMRAEYSTSDQFRTSIVGKVWKKMEEKEEKE